MTSSDANRREYFRLPYPTGVGPGLVVGDQTFPVVELSEHGVQFAGPLDARAGDELSATLRFHDGGELAVTGVVVRRVGEAVAVRLASGVPLDRMLSEQKRIMRAFPGFLQRPTPE